MKTLLGRTFTALGLAALISANASAQGLVMNPRAPHILPIKERAAVVDRWLRERLDTLVAPLMRREGVDMWIMIAGEYDEDPVVKTMLPATWRVSCRFSACHQVPHINGARQQPR